jgi:hypothetical protein
MMSTGMAVTGFVAVWLAANATRLHARIPAWPMHDIVTPVLIVPNNPPELR